MKTGWFPSILRLVSEQIGSYHFKHTYGPYPKANKTCEEIRSLLSAVIDLDRGASMIMAAYILQPVSYGVVPVLLLIWIVRSGTGSRFAFLVKSLLAGCYIGLIFITARWDITGYWLRYIWLVLFCGVLIFGIVRCMHRPLFDRCKLSSAVRTTAYGLLLALAAYAIWNLRDNASYESKPVELAFPLSDPNWYVVHGGSNRFMNPHRHVRAQRYALDINSLNRFGFRAAGLLPKELEAYAAFGRNVISPCDGQVIATRNNLTDQKPPIMDPANLVTMVCKDVTVILAHLQQGSVAVVTGEAVQSGQLLGKIGNSGNTTEPHLHIHAIRGQPDGPPDFDQILFKGEGVPILLDGRFLTRNSMGGDVTAIW